MSEVQDATEPDGEDEARAPQPETPGSAEKKQLYIRTVFPLNPGIPHTVDFPGAWK